ncbi:MAG: serine/threonine-protein kinase [Mycobacteriales bacterium]
MTGVDVPQELQGRYVLGPALGTGGMARVHRATDTVLGRPVAVKIFRIDSGVGDAQRVQEEGRTLAALNHPGLVGVFDAGVISGPEGASPYLVMELVDGPTLAQCCLGGSLAAGEVAQLGAQLADALAHVHDRGFVHRDVKPANILLDPTGRAKLADFGIARLVDSAHQTATGLTIGTAPYLSPEQVTGTFVGPATDVYALGLVLLECLTGQREYSGAGVEAALARLHRPPHVPVSLSEPWPRLLAAMTDPDPQQRPTAAEVATALRLAPSVPGTPTAVLPTPSAPARGLTRKDAGRGAVLEALRNKLFLAGLALLGLLLVAGATTVALSTRPPAQPPTKPLTQLGRDLHDLQSAATP